MFIAIGMMIGAGLLLAGVQIQIKQHGGIDEEAVKMINEKWGH